MNIILGITGSVATTLTPKMASLLLASGHNVKIVATTPALFFLRGLKNDCLPLSNVSGNLTSVEVFRDKDEWAEGGYHKGDIVKHIDFRTWADLLLIAPIGANTLAKIANGICDNFLCCIARAWKKEKPMVLAPAMNTEMWNDVITTTHLDSLPKRYRSLKIIEPISGMLACGDEGIGAMARIENIVKAVDEINAKMHKKG